MSPNARLLIFILGALMLAGGTIVSLLTGGGGISLVIIGAPGRP
jgi:hypothetical protein